MLERRKKKRKKEKKKRRSEMIGDWREGKGKREKPNTMFGWGENREDKKQREENWEEGKPGRKFSLPSPQFSLSQIGRKRLERKVLSQHFYTNALFLFPLTATNTTIFLSNISKLKHNQIIRIQTQKHNFKINQIITKKKTKKKKTKDRRQKPSDPSGLRWG